MDLNGLRIGYVPSSRPLTAPSDRRRFVYYARKKNLKFEIADPSKHYDLVVLSQSADLSVWHRYDKKNGKIVYDLIDPYLAIPRWDLKGILRGLSKFITRQNRYLQISYRGALLSMCRYADAVVCSTEEQKQDISDFCKNVHIILDIHSNEISTIKTNYTSGRKVFNFVWEGLAAGNLPMLRLMREILEPISEKHTIALHLVTDIQYGRYHNKYYKCNTADDIRKIFRSFYRRVYLYQWNESLFSSIINACDLAIIPIPLDKLFSAGKPENKLLLFWRLGMPTIVSATPAYERAMEKCNLPMACRTLPDWKETIEKYINDEKARRDAGKAGRLFAEANYGEEKIIEGWDSLFRSIL